MRNIVTITISSLACVMGLNINMTAAYADSDPYIGDIVLTAATFCPNGWNEANGQTVAIAANQSLYSLIGTKFGGDGTTTFRLPDLRGRFAVGAGSAPGLTPRVVGQQFGSEGVTVPASALPSHTHSVSTASGDAANSPKNKFFVTRDAGINAYTQAAADVAMGEKMVAPSGGGAPMPNRQPYLAMRWCIALQGIYPSTN